MQGASGLALKARSGSSVAYEMILKFIRIQSLQCVLHVHFNYRLSPIIYSLYISRMQDAWYKCAVTFEPPHKRQLKGHNYCCSSVVAVSGGCEVRDGFEAFWTCPTRNLGSSSPICDMSLISVSALGCNLSTGYIPLRGAAMPDLKAVLQHRASTLLLQHLIECLCKVCPHHLAGPSVWDHKFLYMTI